MTSQPDAAQGGTPLGLTVAAVARRMGVAPATLRTWDRRYGLGPSQRSAGAHRRYAPADLDRLAQMRRLLLAGVPAADAARAARAAPDAAAGPDGAAAPGADPAPDPAAEPDAARAARGGARAGGGRVVPLRERSAASRGLARAAMALDAVACTALVREALERHGVVWTWEELLVPVLVGIGRRWETTGEGVEVEHLLSEVAQGCLAGIHHERDGLEHAGGPGGPGPAAGARPGGARPAAGASDPRVLLACADEEMHSLPLSALAAALAERRVVSRLLGARLPHDALLAAIRRTGPAVVVLWSQVPATGDPRLLVDLQEVRPAPLVVVAGPGWAGPLPGGCRRVADLTEAVTLVARTAQP